MVSECLRQEAWVGLDPAELAAVVSAVTYESRTDEPPAPRFPDKAVRDAAEATIRIADDLRQLERSHGLGQLRAPDFGFAQTTWEWASGAALDDVLESSEIAPGDFVRAVKQVIDALGQVSQAATAEALRDTARAALVELRRGIIAHETGLDP